MNKVIGIEKAMEHIRDGQVIMFGGFMAVGTPVKLIDAILEKGVKDITACLRSDNDCSRSMILCVKAEFSSSSSGFVFAYAFAFIWRPLS